MVELIRYPYYLCHIYDIVPKFLKWARYTSWIILFAPEMTSELLILIQGEFRYL